MKLIPYDYQLANLLYNSFHENPEPSFFQGASLQRGYGIGRILKKCFKNNLPVIKKGAMSVGKMALTSGLNALKESAEGKDLKQALLKNFKQGGTDLINKAANHVSAKARKRRLVNIKPSQPNKKRRTRKSQFIHKSKPKGRGSKDIFS